MNISNPNIYNIQHSQINLINKTIANALNQFKNQIIESIINQQRTLWNRLNILENKINKGAYDNSNYKL